MPGARRHASANPFLTEAMGFPRNSRMRSIVTSSLRLIAPSVKLISRGAVGGRREGLFLNAFTTRSILLPSGQPAAIIYFVFF